MNPTVDQLLDMLLDGDPVAWEISRTPDGLMIVALMKNGETRVLANVPITIEAVSYTHLTLPTIYSV